MITPSSSIRPYIFIVIPTHNRWERARLALQSIYSSTYRNFNVVLIEDGCIDRTVEYCTKEFPSARILHGAGDLWWSGAINRGMEYAVNNKADAIVWLNDDDQVEPDTLDALVRSFLRNPRSVICARVKSLSAPDEYGFVEQHPPIHDQRFGERTLLDIEDLRNRDEVEIEHPAGGHGVLFPIECVRDVGYVDDKNFPQYWGDHDYHYRAKKAGYKYIVALNAVVWNAPNDRKAAGGVNKLVQKIRPYVSKYSPEYPISICKIIKRFSDPPEAFWKYLLRFYWIKLKSFLYFKLKSLKVRTAIF